MKSSSLLAALTLLGIARLSQAEVAVITSAANGVSLSLAQVAAIYLGQERSHQAVDLLDWTPTKARFYAKLLDKNEAQLQSYWAGLLFSGQGEPPAVVLDEAAMLESVASSDTRLGYVDKALVDGRVRVLFTLP